MRIVIVEDEILIREGVVRLAGRVNPEYVFVGEADNGIDGLKLILAQKPDLVITDIRMPDMDGLEMLARMREHGYVCHAIVLTAYSEFSYAQQAVRLGVIEYLLKPIIMEDFIRALGQAEQLTKQAVTSGVRHPDVLHSLRAVYRTALDGVGLDDDMRVYLRSAYGIDADGCFSLVLLYPGVSISDAERNAAHALKRRLCDLYGDRARLIELEEERVLALISASACDGLEPLLTEALKDTHFVVGYTQCAGVNTLREAERAAAERLDTAITTGKRFQDMRSLPEDRHYQVFVYPLGIEHRARAALWALEVGRLEREFDAFFAAAFSAAEPHRPHEIKECYVRLLWALLSDAKERGYPNARGLDCQALLEQVMDAVTREELFTARDMLLQVVRAPAPGAQAQPGEVVSRARAMIHEYYTSGITLEEISEKLCITPEYLSQQFHKEIGINYSAYIRALRMDKAKELLRTTELKVYEVAKRVGYADSKYFARVFKAETGRMPCGYRSRP
ncbi:MAG: response regulator [Eubacteriales bacterium]|nr:response regulator [Eubacteriales bacterium]